jgi:NAD(P)-dependent dehydrogenase (short-subunit alcohol dehydrogenase family)
MSLHLLHASCIQYCLHMTAADWGPFSLSGRRAVITGAARGMGLAMARRFVEAGAAVALVDRDGEALEKAAIELPDAHSIVADISVPDAGAAVLAEAVAALGPVDVLINDAAIMGGMLIEDLTSDFLDAMYTVNLRAPILLAQAFAAQFGGAAGTGRIVNVSSVSAFRAARRHVAYGSLKAALASATMQLAEELGPRGITVNAIAPGCVKTGHEIAPDDRAWVEAERAKHVERSPLGRLGEPDEVACVATFLASGASSYITGQTIWVDGGRFLG